MTKEEIYLDLSKLSEEQRKEVLRIILNKGQKNYKEDELLLKKKDYTKMIAIFFLLMKMIKNGFRLLNMVLIFT